MTTAEIDALRRKFVAAAVNPRGTGGSRALLLLSTEQVDYLARLLHSSIVWRNALLPDEAVPII